MGDDLDDAIRTNAEGPASASDETGVSIQKALHICRGHFKDYRKSGLFGKIAGIFWWDQHARGSADCGIVKSTHVIETN